MPRGKKGTRRTAAETKAAEHAWYLAHYIRHPRKRATHAKPAHLRAEHVHRTHVHRGTL